MENRHILTKNLDGTTVFVNPETHKVQVNPQGVSNKISVDTVNGVLEVRSPDGLSVVTSIPLKPIYGIDEFIGWVFPAPTVAAAAADPVVLFSGNSGSSGQVTLSENANKFTRLEVSFTQGAMQSQYNVTQPYTVGGAATQGRVTLAPDGVSMTVDVVSGDPGDHGDNWVYNVTGYYD